MEYPELGWVTDVKYIKNYDADSIDLEIRKKIRVRLLDCWAPEIKSKDQYKKEIAKEGRDFVNSVLSSAKEIRLFIPTEQSGDFSHLMTFDRLLGYIWVDGKNLNELIVKNEFASSKKDGKLGE